MDILKRLFGKSLMAKICVGVLLFIVLGAVFCPMLSPFDYASQNVAFTNQPPLSVDPINGSVHILGTDSLGRDLFVRLWYGARISLLIAVVIALIDCLIGVVYGGISGYLGGMVDQVMMRFVEIISGIPYLIIVLLLVAVLPRGFGTLIIAYSITGWTGMARIVRGQVLSLCHKEFILAEKVMGAAPWTIIGRHLIPNITGLIIVNVTLDIPSVIFTEAFLSLIGLGITPPTPSLGIMADQGIQVFQSYPEQLIYPTLLIVIISFTLNLLGDRLRDAFDPQERRAL